jgi:hypothetical protein
MLIYVHMYDINAYFFAFNDKIKIFVVIFMHGRYRVWRANPQIHGIRRISNQ